MYNKGCTPLKLDSSGESDSSQSPENKCWTSSLSSFNYLMLRMADNSDGDSDNCEDFGDDGDLMEKIRKLEKEKEKLARKNGERAKLEKQYRELSKSVKSLKDSASVSSGYGSCSPSPGTLDKNRISDAGSVGLSSILNEQRARLKNLTNNRSSETSVSKREESGEESESDEDKDSKNLDKVMSTEHKSKLQSNRDTLVESMIPDDIFNDLIANKVLTTADVSRIKEKNTREAMNEELLNNLVRRSDRAFYEFVRSLHKTLQGYLADLLEDPIPKPPSKKRQKRKRQPGELSINVDCEDVAPASSKKKPLCSCQEVEEQILLMAKTAYLAIRRRDTTPAAFEQFKKELSQTNEILRESMEVMNTLKMLCEHGRTMNNISYGSIQFTMLCNSVEGAKDLWEKYSHGHLLDKFQQGLVTKSLLKGCHAKWVKLRVRIAEEEYLQCLREIENSKSHTGDKLFTRRRRLRSSSRKSSEENCMSFPSPYSSIPEAEPRRAFKELQRNLGLDDHVHQPKKQRIITECETVSDMTQRNLLYNFRLRSQQPQ